MVAFPRFAFFVHLHQLFDDLKLKMGSCNIF